MEKENLSVCFSDLSNFNKLMTELADEQVIEILQELTARIGDVIVKFDGLIWKYIGDSILFTFTSPQNAVSAVKEIAAIRKSAGSLLLQAHVSCATGEVYSVKFGHSSLVISDIFGKTVNKAAILLSKANKSESNYALCEKTAKYL